MLDIEGTQYFAVVLVDGWNYHAYLKTIVVEAESKEEAIDAALAQADKDGSISDNYIYARDVISVSTSGWFDAPLELEVTHV